MPGLFDLSGLDFSGLGGFGDLGALNPELLRAAGATGQSIPDPMRTMPASLGDPTLPAVPPMPLERPLGAGPGAAALAPPPPPAPPLAPPLAATPSLDQMAVDQSVMQSGAVGAALGGAPPGAPTDISAQQRAQAGQDPRANLASVLRGVVAPKPPEAQKIQSPSAPRPAGQIKPGDLQALLMALNAGAPLTGRLPVTLGGRE